MTSRSTTVTTSSFDRSEWFRKLRETVLAKKVHTIKLTPRGATFAELQSGLGKDIACEMSDDGTIVLGIKQK